MRYRDLLEAMGQHVAAFASTDYDLGARTDSDGGVRPGPFIGWVGLDATCEQVQADARRGASE